MKQETIEEFAERINPTIKQETIEDVFNIIDDEKCRYSTDEDEFWNHYKIGVIDGLKWQQERSYSEQEVLKLLHKRGVHNMHYPSTFNKGWETPEEWFEKFKKK